ncbi:MAG: response regulator [Actinobacteria bacterium]|nr:response regulator [Actinomycetota bacterium]
MAGYRVLVVQREPFALTSIVNALVYRGLDVVGRAATAREALDLQRDQEPEVAVLDLDLGSGPSGIELAQALRIRQQEIGLVMLSSFRDPRLFAPEMSVLPPGTSYLCKSDVDDFGAVADRVIDSALSPLEARDSTPNALPSLTTKQISVLRLVAQGKSTHAIATELQMTPKAVEQSISMVGDILGVPAERSVNQPVLLARAYLTLAGKLIDDRGRVGAANAVLTSSDTART